MFSHLIVTLKSFFQHDWKCFRVISFSYWMGRSRSYWNIINWALSTNFISFSFKSIFFSFKLNGWTSFKDLIKVLFFFFNDRGLFGRLFALKCNFIQKRYCLICLFKLFCKFLKFIFKWVNFCDILINVSFRPILNDSSLMSVFDCRDSFF